MQRVVGVDVARGLAILGMFAAHVGDAGPRFWSATGWLQVADGRPSAAFALLAGVSAALLSGGTTPPAALTRARVRIAVRAALVYVLGAALVVLGTPIAVILPAYAVMFGLLLPLLGRPARTLLVLAGAVLVVAPPVMVAVTTRWPAGGPQPWWVELLFPRHYPPAVWIVYLMIGLAVGRQDLGSAAVRWRLVRWGSVAALAGHGTGAVARRLAGPGDARWSGLLSDEPHANTAPEVLGNVGIVLLVLVVCLVLGERATRLVAPVAATGALALTAYTVHLVAIAALGPQVVRDPHTSTLVVFVVVTLVLTTAWRTWWGRGPLERLLHGASIRAADLVVPAPRAPHRT